MRRYIAIIAMSAALLLPHASNAAESSTSSAASLGPFGGNTWDSAVDSVNGYVYTTAKDSPNGFYWSDDQATQWNGISDANDYGGGMAVEVNPTNGDVYATFAQGLYKSTDHGRTFTKILDDGSHTLLFTDGKILLGSNQSPGVVKISADNGATFSNSTVTTTSGENIWGLSAGPTGSNTYIAMSYDSSNAVHLYKTTNAAVSWTEMTLPSFTNNTANSQVCVSPINADIIAFTTGYSSAAFTSTNGGTSWTSAATGLSCAFDGNGRMIIGSSISSDAITFTSLGAGASAHHITIDPSNPNVMYADGAVGLSKSTDGGITWADSSLGIKGVTITDVSQANDKNIVWAAAYNGVARTSNYLSSTPTWEFPVITDASLGIWVKPNDSNVVVVGGIGFIKQTTDGGVTWNSVAGDLVSHDVAATDFIQDPVDANTLYAAVASNEPQHAKNGAVLVSHDGGATWADLSVPDAASTQTLGITSTGILYAGAGGPAGSSSPAFDKGVYKYANGTWTHLTTGLAEEVVDITVDPENDNTIYLVSSRAYGNGDRESFGFYKSTDGGSTWTKKPLATSGFSQYNSIAVQRSTSPNTLYVSAVDFDGRGVLYKSTDGGDNWDKLYTGLRDDTFYSLLFDGVMGGTSRGIVDVKSKASVKMTRSVKKPTVGKKVKLTATVKDAATGKVLKKKTVKVYEKTSSKKRKLIKIVKTDKKGKFSVTVTPKKAKKYQYYAEWKPGNSDKDEYTTSKSTTMVFTAKKK